MEWYYRLVPFLAAKRAQAVITVSQASKESIVEYLKLASERVFVTYEAAKSIYQPMVDAELANNIVRSFGLESNYILGIGSADRRKNIRSLIKAYSLLPKHLMQNFHLAIVWNHNSLALESFLEAQKLNISEHVHFLNNVSDEQLVSLYNRASLFVFPSLEEGFGLPPLEAMACGTPVVAANNSSIPEIVGDAAIQFPGENIQDLKEAIIKVLCDSELQSRMRESGIERSTHFSWEKCARDTMDVYKQAMFL